MKYAIHINALSSIFQDSSEKSKQTSQLLFGELCTIKSERDDYYYIENSHDKHSGWVLKFTLLELTFQEFDRLKAEALLRVCMPLVDVFNLKDKTVLRLPLGSIIPNYNPDSNKFTIGDSEFQIHSSFVSYLPHGSLDGILEVALALRNTPFMSGGKSVLGLDKSGFVQLVFNLCGYSIPRNTPDQQKVGISVNGIENLEKGDLLFILNNDIFLDSYVYLADNEMVGVGRVVQVCTLDELDISSSSLIIRRLV